MQPPDYGQRQGSVPAKHLVNSRPAADDADQRLPIRALLLEAEFDRFDGIRRIDGKMRLLIRLDEGREHLQPISFRGAFVRPPGGARLHAALRCGRAQS